MSDQNEIHELRRQLKEQGRELADRNRERAGIEYDLARTEVTDAFVALGANRDIATGWSEVILEGNPEVIDLPFLQRWMSGAKTLRGAQ